MNRRSVIGLILLSLVLGMSAMATKPNPNAPHPAVTVDSLSWLVGKWQGVQGDKTIYEEWALKDAKTLTGVGGEIQGDTLVPSEQMRMEQTETGFQFVAIVAHNKGEVAFPLVRHDSTGFVFENPTHDFPRRVIYNPVAVDSLHARIEGPGRDGKTKGFDFVYTRVK